jgi:hypothetical protein
MKKRPFYWYLILPALYAGIMLFFALIQFRDTESESYAMGPMIFTADRGSLETDESLSGLRVTINRGTFRFGPENPVSLRKDGASQQVQLTGFQAYEDRAVVSFQQGFQLQFLQGEDEWRILPILEEGLLEEVNLPFSISSTIPDKFAGIPILVLGGESTHYLRLPSGASFDPRNDELTLLVKERGARTLVVERGNEEHDPFRYWLHGNDEEPDIDAFHSQLEEYWTESYQGWSTGRWINAASGWRLPEGGRGFDSELARSLSSPRAKIGGSTRSTSARPRFTGTLTGRNWDFGVSPYFGRLTTSIPSYTGRSWSTVSTRQDEAFPGAYSGLVFWPMDTLLWPVSQPGVQGDQGRMVPPIWMVSRIFQLECPGSL